MTACGGIRSLFASAVPELDPKRCLNTRHGGANCTRCFAVCPATAIGLPGVTPEINAELCVECGACLTVCPSSAISIPSPIETALARAFETTPVGDIGLVCALHPNPGESPVPATTVVRHGMCLASLDAGQLLALAGDGSRRIFLDTSRCVTCPISSVRRLIEQTAETTNRLAEIFDQPIPIGVVHEGTPMGTRVVVEGSHRGFTRRDLFTSVGRRREAPGEPMTRPGAAVADRLPVAIPRHRKRLMEQLERWAVVKAPETVVATEGTPFAAITINSEDCSGCGLCGRFCPTGSLVFHEAEGSFTLGFRASLCIDCGICSVACPEAAVSFGTGLPAGALVDGEWSALLVGPITRCEVCGGPTRGEGDQGVRCPTCRRGSGRVLPLRDEAGLMKDLLSRIDDLKGE